MNKYNMTKKLKKVRGKLLFALCLVLVFLFVKKWYLNTKEEAREVYEQGKDLFTSEEYKAVAQDKTQKVIDNVIGFVKKGSDYIDEKTPVVQDFVSDVIDKNFVGENTNTARENEKQEEIANPEQTENTTSLQRVELWCTIDGDTIMVKDENGEMIKVRLIGINTPESVHANEELNNKYGKEASEWLEKYVEDGNYLYGQPIYLEYDVSLTDIYDRTLAYVWLKDNIDTQNDSDIRNYMLNSVLVENGYAEAVVYEPNEKYSSYFATYENEAKESHKGLWQYEEFNLFD